MKPRAEHARRAWMIALVVASNPAGAQRAPSDSIRLARLSALGQVWGTVKYFHPGFLSRSINWDSAVIAAIPRVNAARTTSEYRAAVQTMLAELGDPQTRVVSATDTPPMKPPVEVRFRWDADSTLIVSIPTFENPPELNRQLRPLLGVIGAARRIVFDLRGPIPDDVGYASTSFNRAGISSLLPSASTLGLGSRRRMYFGFPSQFDGRGAAGAYWTAAYETGGQHIYAQPGNPVRRVSFVIHERSDVPEIAWALQRTGEGQVVIDGSTNSVPHQLAGPGLPRLVHFIPIGDGLQAQIRTGEMVGPSGGPLAADTVLAVGPDGDAPLRAALAFVRGEAMPTARVARPALPVTPEDAYAGSRYPSLALRILAAYRWWSAIQYFYPHKTGIGVDWNAALTESISDLQSAMDSTEYLLAVAKMRARIRDSHYNNPDLFGAGMVGVSVRFVEGLPIVTAVRDDSATRVSGVTVGDIIETVDGESVAARRARFVPYISASTPQSLDWKVAGYLLRGPVGSVALLSVQRASGPPVRVTLTRYALVRTPNAPREYDDDGNPILSPRGRAEGVIRIESGNIGYADLTRVTARMVDSMFDVLGNTTAIVFDMRGYPSDDTRAAIVARLSDHMISPPGETLMVLSPDSTTSTIQRGGQYVVKASEKAHYLGKTVLLIDERAQSAAEDMGLWLEAANGTAFVGSPTAGADGTITSVVLPGGIRANFTGMSMLHSDGRPLQRIGLIPDVEVRPTIAGIRAGRDEVLERAFDLLRGVPR